MNGQLPSERQAGQQNACIRTFALGSRIPEWGWNSFLRERVQRHAQITNLSLCGEDLTSVRIEFAFIWILGSFPSTRFLPNPKMTPSIKISLSLLPLFVPPQIQPFHCLKLSSSPLLHSFLPLLIYSGDRTYFSFSGAFMHVSLMVHLFT